MTALIALAASQAAIAILTDFPAWDRYGRRIDLGIDFFLPILEESRPLLLICLHPELLAATAANRRRLFSLDLAVVFLRHHSGDPATNTGHGQACCRHYSISSISIASRFICISPMTRRPIAGHHRHRSTRPKSHTKSRVMIPRGSVSACMTLLGYCHHAIAFRYAKLATVQNV